MAKSASYGAYDQVAHPNAGITAQAGKMSDCPEDALGRPGRYSRSTPAHATEKKNSVKTARDKQLGSNGPHGN